MTIQWTGNVPAGPAVVELRLSRRFDVRDTPGRWLCVHRYAVVMADALTVTVWGRRIRPSGRLGFRSGTRTYVGDREAWPTAVQDLAAHAERGRS